MEKLSGLDASFLYFETAQTPMHVAGLTLYEVPEAQRGHVFEHFRDFFRTRAHLVPIFGKKLARTVLELDHPGWVDAGEIDFDYHIKGHTLDAPGTLAQLEEWVALEHARPLDRSKPLWQFTVVDGLEGGRAALYSKVHHAAVDGGAGMAITQAIYDLTPEPRKVAPPEPRERGRVPSVPERAVLGLHDMAASMVSQQMKMLEAVPKVMGQMAEMMAQVADPQALTATRFIAPKTPFNVTLGRRRTYAARTLPLSGAKAISKASGAKINEVVMAIVSGALRRYLKRHDALPQAPLIAFVPVSLRQPGDGDQNNQVTGMNCPLATDIADPSDRLARIVDDSARLKSVVGTFKDSSPKDYTLLGAPLLLPGLMRLYGGTKLADVVPQAVNLTISNTPGPPFPLFCNGAKVTNLYPVSIATHGVGLNVTVQSYLDNLDFGITAGRRAMPDIEDFAADLRASFEELRDAVCGVAEPEADDPGRAPEPKRKPAAKPAAKPKTKARKPAAKANTKATRSRSSDTSAAPSG